MKYSILYSFIYFGWYGSFQAVQADSFVPLNYTLTTIDVPGSTNTSIYGINSNDQLVGVYTDNTGAQQGFLDTNGTFTTLPFVPTGINNVGQIVGLSGNNLVVDTNGAINQIALTALPRFGGLPSYIGTRLARINDLGQIVGNYYDQYFGIRGFLYTDGTFTLLPAAIPNYQENIYAQGINNSGQILLSISEEVGYSNYLYQNGQYTTRVLDCSECTFVSGTALNNIGQALGTNGPGTYVDTNGVVGAFSFYRDLGISVEAFDINDLGQIVGGNAIATPVPEPSSLLLFAGGLGLAGLFAVRRRIQSRANLLLQFCSVFGLLLGSSFPIAADILYSVTDLSTLSEGRFYPGYALNNAGQVAGTADSGQHASLYSNGQFTDLTTGAPGTVFFSDGYGINNTGQVVGYINSTAGSYAALFSNGQVINLGELARNSVESERPSKS